MTTEPPLAIRDVLAARPPFNQLPAAVLDLLAQQLETRRLAAGEVVLEAGQPNAWLHVIASGELEVRDPDGSLLARLGAGEVFGQRSLLADGIADNRVQAVADSLLYRLPAAAYHALCRDHAAFRFFFGPAAGLRGAVQGDSGGLHLMTAPVADLVGRAPVTVAAGAGIGEAAGIMTRE
nr:cyclic nucleotide-binding domain-containing protein [Pseudomonadota bacterium]